MKSIEVIFLERTNGMIVGSSFQGFYDYRYNVNPQKLLQKTLNAGLIKVSDIEESLYNATLTELKSLLRKESLKVSGKKDELVDRLIQNLSKSQLKHEFPKKYYVLTSKGKKIIEENKFAIFYHKYQNLSDEVNLETYEEAVIKDPTQTFHDISINLLSEKSTFRRNEKSWGLFRNILLSIAGIYNIKEDYDSYIKYVIKVCIIDLSGLQNQSYSPKLILLAPGVIHPLGKMLSKLEKSKEYLSNIIEQSIKELILPQSFFNQSQIKEFIFMAIENYDEACDLIEQKTSKVKSEIDIFLENRNERLTKTKKKRKKGIFDFLFGKK